MHIHRKPFVSSLSPGEVFERFWELCAEEGWAPVESDEASAHAKSGPTLRSAGEDIRVSIEPGAEGTQVHLVVSPRLGVLQVVDWGEGRMVQRAVLDRLSPLGGGVAGGAPAVRRVGAAQRPAGKQAGGRAQSLMQPGGHARPATYKRGSS